jgi:pyridoxine/pyridoxamine 5'-phosphate oxidase
MTGRAQKILDFIRTQQIGVLATTNSESFPEAASMSISQTDALGLIFQTPNTTRKYANLQMNPHVAAVFGWSLDDFITVQYEGIAREVTDDTERARVAAVHVAANPKSKPYANLPDNKFFVVSPTRISYSNIPESDIFTLDTFKGM